jgi:xanthine dehydrogenase accessory factor
LLRSGAAAYVTQHSAQGTVVEALVEPMLPPPHLFLFGTAHDATPVITLAKNLGWSVSVWDGQPRISARERLLAADHYLTGPLSDALTSLERCARPVAVVMGHHYEQDRAVLSGLLRGRASYIGVLGPRRRTDRMLAESGMRVSEAMLERVYAPVGLQLGAETPAEIALAILAEAQAVLTRSHAQGLRLHAAAIHPRDATTHAWGELAVSAE